MTENTALSKKDTPTKGDGDFQFLFPLEEMGQRTLRGKSEGQTSQNMLVSPAETTAISTERLRTREIPIIRPEHSFEPRGRTQTLQQYEGVVLSVGQDTFWAKLIDKTTAGKEDEQGEFPFDEVSEFDRRLVKPGAVFYWHVGYYDSASGQRTRQSEILFRRLPALTGECLERSRLKARNLMETFKRAEEREPGGEE